ncbi:MAG: helix-turn-helix domain-containing protein [Calditrichia bacterium]
MEEGVQTFNSQEAAKILGVNVSTIKRWTDSGKLACIRSAGGHRKFLMEHLAEFLDNNKNKTEKVNLFPIENESDLRLSNRILKGDFNYLTRFILEQSLACNREKVQKVLNGLYLGQYPLHEIYDRVLTPVLHRIGGLWMEEKITVIEEHIASQTIRDALMRLQGIIRIPEKKKGKVLCLNLYSELHDMALKMVDHVLELRGYRVLFSGQLTPMFAVDKIFESFRPERVYISTTYVENREKVQEQFDDICGLAEMSGSKVFVGGQGFDRINIDHPAVVRRLLSFSDVNTF